MKNKAKRSLRRHHEGRVKAKFHKIAKRQAGTPGDWTHVRTFVDGRSVPCIDLSRLKKREESIFWNTTRRAHHPTHFCQMCKRPRYNRKKDR